MAQSAHFKYRERWKYMFELLVYSRTQQKKYMEYMILFAYQYSHPYIALSVPWLSKEFQIMTSQVDSASSSIKMLF
jgi:hypothetical protein